MYTLRLSAALLVSTLPGLAAITFFSGFDPAAGPGDPQPNSALAAANFAAAVDPLSNEPLSINTWDRFPSGFGSGYGWDRGKNLGFSPVAAVQSEIVDVAGTTPTGFNISTAGVKFDRITPQSGHGNAGMIFSSDDEPAAGFGIYLTGYGGVGDSLLFTLNGSEPQQFPVSAPLQAGVLFIGVVSDAPFRQVTLRWENASGLSDTFAIDDVTWASSRIPEPAPFGLMGAGLAIGAVVAVRPRFRRATHAFRQSWN
jgi:hypothetical protein